MPLGSNISLQILCDSSLLKLLPSHDAGYGDQVFKDIYKIKEDLWVPLFSPGLFTKEMKWIVRKFTGTDQVKIIEEHDPIELLERVIGYLIDSCAEAEI